MLANYVIMPNGLKEIFLDCLRKENIDCTLVSTTSMFLREGQTTCVIVADDDTIGDKITMLITKAKKIFRKTHDGRNIQNVFFFQSSVLNYRTI